MCAEVGLATLKRPNSSQYSQNIEGADNKPVSDAKPIAGGKKQTVATIMRVRAAKRISARDN
ncbi:hypothetical protein [Pseudovibrio sp. Ad13]|uniref:hypothetical protein n=1 Tax=Pseudovibrio sp. Ad13 TaxID=989396 RepID=UPI0007AE524D|nr:hypothetical protein [Pseudovibrio sp. Ad13]